MKSLPRELAGAVAGLVGGGALVAVGIGLRGALRVPALPEVLAEGTTFYIPFQLFAFMINTFGTQAKVILVATIFALMALASVGVGILYARRPLPRTAIGLALGLWLLTLLVILPASGFGFFGAEVRAGPAIVAAVYLLAWAAFALALSLVYWLLVPSSRQRRGRPTPLAREVSH